LLDILVLREHLDKLSQFGRPSSGSTGIRTRGPQLRGRTPGVRPPV